MTNKIWLLFLIAASFALLHKEVLAVEEEEKKANPEEEDYINDDDEYDGGEGDEEEPYTGPPPIIHSRARDLSVKPGETVKFPCEVEHADRVALMWMKNNQMLWTDKFKVVKDKRFEKLADNTLEIRNVNPSDVGMYRCKLGNMEKQEVNHTLNILMTPRIEKLLPGATKILQKGNPLTLECKVTGYPSPTVTWTRKGKNLPNGEEAMEGVSITFESVTRKHAGVYECMASNGIGEPATATVDVHVQYAPEIEIEKEIVNSGEGYDAELVCEVHAEPKPKVGWFRDGVAIPSKGQDRLTITKQGSKHILQVANTQKSDFGSYTCHANNTLGRIDRVIELSGEPSPAKFVSGEEMENKGQKLEWVVESHSPVTSYELKFKSKKMSDWKILHPMVENPEGNVYTVRQELEGLSSGQYEVILLSQNTYGWSKPSTHIFELKPSLGEVVDSAAAPVQSPLLAILTILSLSTFFL